MYKINFSGDAMKKTFKYVLILISLTGILFTMISAGFDDTRYSFLKTLNTLKYFTIQSNIILFAYFVMSLLPKFSQNRSFKKAFGAVLIYITVTFIVFATLLENIWHPEGLALAGDLLNHYITPILAIIYYLYFRKDYEFAIKDIKYWFVYPLVYLVFLIIHGIITQDYIYPFFNINVFGIFAFLIVLSGILLFGLLLAFAIVFISKIHSKKGEYE